MSVTPRVAIVGRPNVGKSTLFNRFVGRRQSIVHDLPGVTRDRITGDAELDTGHAIEIVDTGGLLTGEDVLGINAQVMLAVEESDLLVVVVDGTAGVTAADQEIVTRLRPHGKPIVLVVNKSDTREAQSRFSDFYRLGIEPQILLSAEHGRGIEDLRQALILALPASPAAELSEVPPVAIVGRPNVGKSSLVNRLIGRQRVLVSPQAGTTRDPIDTLLERDGKSYLLVDTAGIRRRAKVSGAPEEIAVMLARRQIERAQVAVLVIDAFEGVTSGDLTIAGVVWEQGRAAVVAINKWDLLDEDAREHLELTYPRLQELLADPPRVNLSALTGRGAEKLFPAIDKALVGFRTSLTTGEINRLFEGIVTRHRPPADRGGHPWKLYYTTQVASGPPTFMLFANRTLPLQDPYRRYIENRLREHLGLPGVPIRLVIRRR